MSYTDFYMQTTASNLNAGSTAADSPVYSSTAGSFDGTSVYTPTDGQTTSSLVNVGDWCSIFPSANTTTPFVAQVTVVGAGVNGAITVSTTVKFGTAPGAVACKARTGGAWADFGMVASGVALATGTVPLSTRINVRAGTYANGTTNRTLALAGTTTIPLWWRGYKTTIGDQDSNATPVAATDVPSITWTSNGQFLPNGNYQELSSLAFSGATNFALVQSSGSFLRLYGVSVSNTGAGAGTGCVNFNGTSQAALFCFFSAPTTATNCISSGGGGVLTLDGCIVSGGTAAVTVSTHSVVLRDCWLVGQGGDSVTVSTGSVFVLNTTVYNTAGNGVNLTSTGSLYVTSSYFEGMPGGKTAIVNTSGTNTGQATLIANSYFNVGAMTSGFGDFPLIFDNGLMTSSALTSSVNPTPTSALYALAWPGKYLSTSVYQSYRYGGAIQPNTSTSASACCSQP